MKKHIKIMQSKSTEIEKLSLIELMPFPVFKVNTDLKILWANNEARKINNRLVNHYCYYAFCGGTEQCAKCICERVIKDGEMHKGIKYHHNHVLGPSYWDYTVIPVYKSVENKDIDSLYICCHNITEYMVKLRELDNIEGLSSKIMTNSLNPIIIFNPDMSISYVNPAFQNLTGFSCAELVGINAPYPWWTDIGKSKIIADHKKVKNGKILRQLEHVFQDKKGLLINVEINTANVEINGQVKYRVSNWTDITKQKRLESNLKLYALDITNLQEQERKYFSRELHDVTIQRLSHICHEIDIMHNNNVFISQDLIRIRSQIESILDEVRRFCHKLRPGLLDRFGLIAALEFLCEEINGEALGKVNLEVINNKRRLSPEIETQLFRISQEAVNNAIKHSNASGIDIRISFYKKSVKLEIIDDGIGFQIPEVLVDFASKGQFGIIGIRERVSLIGGTLIMHSKIGSGTRIIIKVNS